MLDNLIKEPFLGFSKESLAFLKKLEDKKYNNKIWFDKNRNIYEDYIKLPIRALMDSLTGELYKIDSTIVVSYKSILRINRDIRFLFAGGQYSTDPDKLKKIRKRIYDDFDYFKKIISNKNFIKEYGNISGEKLSNMPRGYDDLKIGKKNELLIELMKMNLFI